MRSRLNALTQERADLVAEGKKLLGLAEEEDRDPTKDEAKRDDEIEARLGEIAGFIAREERQVAREGLVDPVQTTNPNGDNAGGEDAEPPKVTPFKTFGEQLVAVVASTHPGGAADSRLLDIQAATGLSEGVPADGGFLVQTDFSSELLKNTYDLALVAGRCRTIPISANANGIKINAINETSRVDGSRSGGVLAYWKGEAAAKAASDPELRQIELELKKLTGLCYATDELLQDATAMEAIIRQAFAEEFAFKIDDAIIRGTGAGMPLGILNAGALVTVAKETGQTAATVLFQNIVKMWARLYSRSKANAAWFVNPNVVPQLQAMSLAVGTGGGPVYMPPGGISGAPYGTLFGRPVIEIEHCETLGTVGDIILADFRQYILINKGGMQGASSIHVKFIYDETTFRFVYRTDGQPWWNSALTPFKGGATNTVSPFVVLAARA